MMDIANCPNIFIPLFIVLAAPCGMWDLSPRPKIEPVPPAVKVQSLNPWTAREIPQDHLLKVVMWPPGPLIEKLVPFCSSCAFNLMKYDRFCFICTTFHCQHSSETRMEMTK